MNTAGLVILTVLLTPICGVTLYWMLLGLLDVAETLRDGESLWIGPRQADLVVAHLKATGELPDIDAYCLRKRVWRKLRARA